MVLCTTSPFRARETTASARTESTATEAAWPLQTLGLHRNREAALVGSPECLGRVGLTPRRRPRERQSPPWRDGRRRCPPVAQPLGYFWCALISRICWTWRCRASKSAAPTDTHRSSVAPRDGCEDRPSWSARTPQLRVLLAIRRQPALHVPQRRDGSSVLSAVSRKVRSVPYHSTSMSFNIPARPVIGLAPCRSFQ